MSNENQNINTQIFKSKTQEKLPLIARNRTKSATIVHKFIQEGYLLNANASNQPDMLKQPIQQILNQIPHSSIKRSSSNNKDLSPISTDSPRQGLFLQLKSGKYKEEKIQLSPRQIQKKDIMEKIIKTPLTQRDLKTVNSSQLQDENTQIQKRKLNLSSKPPINKRYFKKEKKAAKSFNIEKPKNKKDYIFPSINQTLKLPIKEKMIHTEESQTYSRYGSGDYSSERLNTLRELFPEFNEEIYEMSGHKSTRIRKKYKSLENKTIKDKLDILSKKKKGTLKTYDF